MKFTVRDRVLKDLVTLSLEAENAGEALQLQVLIKELAACDAWGGTWHSETRDGVFVAVVKRRTNENGTANAGEGAV